MIQPAAETDFILFHVSYEVQRVQQVAHATMLIGEFFEVSYENCVF